MEGRGLMDEAPPTCQDLRLVENAVFGSVGHQHVGQLLVAVLALQQQDLVVPDGVRLVGGGSRRCLRNLVAGDLGLQERRRSQRNGGVTAAYARTPVSPSLTVGTLPWSTRWLLWRQTCVTQT